MLVQYSKACARCKTTLNRIVHFIGCASPDSRNQSSYKPQLVAWYSPGTTWIHLTRQEKCRQCYDWSETACCQMWNLYHQVSNEDAQVQHIFPYLYMNHPYFPLTKKHTEIWNSLLTKSGHTGGRQTTDQQSFWHPKGERS